MVMGIIQVIGKLNLQALQIHVGDRFCGRFFRGRISGLAIGSRLQVDYGGIASS